MRVICINENWIYYGDVLNPPRPRFMEECEVLGEADIKCRMTGVIVPCFRLNGFPDHHYCKSNFAILPDQTSDEINAQHKEAILM